MRRFALVSLALVGCARQTSTSTIPEVRQPVRPYREVRLDPDHRLWVYAPGGVTKGKPCVVVAPAGAHGFDGMALGEGDMPEQTPYVKAGYVVVAYDVSGPMDGQSLRAATLAARVFMEADAGVSDGKRAVGYALRTLSVDPNRVVVAGHSSAATLALALAENDPRVRSCLAYAPIIDERERLGRTLPILEKRVHGLTDRLVRFSPLGNPDGLTVPTLVFHAQDDDVAPLAPIVAFTWNRANAELLEVPRGGHYDSMIREGIPAGLRFLWKHGFAP